MKPPYEITSKSIFSFWVPILVALVLNASVWFQGQSQVKLTPFSIHAGINGGILSGGVGPSLSFQYTPGTVKLLQFQSNLILEKTLFLICRNNKFVIHLQHNCCDMKPVKTIPFNTGKSIKKSTQSGKAAKAWKIDSEGKTYAWSNTMERVGIIRKGIPCSSVETISKRLNRPVKSVLSIVGMPQTTYNKKKSEHSLFDSRNSELIVLITELIDFGLEVFNNEEEKFQRWLKKPNLSLGGHSPESMLDTTTGIDEVKFVLNRIEFGSFA